MTIASRRAGQAGSSAGAAWHTLEGQKTSQAKGGKFVVGLVIGGVVGAVLVLYAADRVLKARAQVRRLRSMSDRLAAATAKAEEQEKQRQVSAKAGEALTSVLPAIKRPPLSVPGMRSHGTARWGTDGAARRGSGCDSPGQHDHAPGHPGKRPSRTGEHAARPTDRAQR
ncbi:MAG TPA: hypothetical protein VKD66_03870 [Streptosporangiaceae bacterium]|nr:hypothetical protein [Streptosporangiaceae bacterium]